MVASIVFYACSNSSEDSGVNPSNGSSTTTTTENMEVISHPLHSNSYFLAYIQEADAMLEVAITHFNTLTDAQKTTYFEELEAIEATYEANPTDANLEVVVQKMGFADLNVYNNYLGNISEASQNLRENVDFTDTVISDAIGDFVGGSNLIPIPVGGIGQLEDACDRQYRRDVRAANRTYRRGMRTATGWQSASLLAAEHSLAIKQATDRYYRCKNTPGN